jgi:hypothetical protein
LSKSEVNSLVVEPKGEGNKITNLEIPDPFAIFVANRYNGYKGIVRDFFTGEWYMSCLSCDEDLFAPSRKIMTKIRLYHTRNECLNGY